MSQLLSELPVGSLVRDPDTAYNNTPIVWQILEHGHTGDPQNSTTLQTKDILTVKAFDAKEPTNPNTDIQEFGNGKYAYSNLLQWLNSNETGVSWYSAKHEYDAPPTQENVDQGYNSYDDEDGFLANFSESFGNALLTASKPTFDVSSGTGVTIENVTSKIFLTSEIETNNSTYSSNNAETYSISEGSAYELYSEPSSEYLYKNFATASASDESEVFSTSWWCRTPASGFLSNTVYVYDGSTKAGPAFNGEVGVAPACCISSSTTVSDDPDENGIYTLIFNSSSGDDSGGGNEGGDDDSTDPTVDPIPFLDEDVIFKKIRGEYFAEIIPEPNIFYRVIDENENTHTYTQDLYLGDQQLNNGDAGAGTLPEGARYATNTQIRNIIRGTYEYDYNDDDINYDQENQSEATDEEIQTIIDGLYG